MRGYYARTLSGERLRRCYEVASSRVRQYLEAEIEFLVNRLQPTDTVLELGCGYGRVTTRLAAVATRAVGVDNSAESLVLAHRLAGPESRCRFLGMDASVLAIREGTFDLVVCVQNGICAFAVDPERLVREALRVTRPGGRVAFSSYAAEFWPERLEWFEAQAAAGLLGAVDYGQTGNGTVVCRDGFRSGTFSPEAFQMLCHRVGADPTITTVDHSSVFCEIVTPELSRTTGRHPKATPAVNE